jgi:hypothetical protein
MLFKKREKGNMHILLFLSIIDCTRPANNFKHHTTKQQIL